MAKHNPDHPGERDGGGKHLGHSNSDHGKAYMQAGRGHEANEGGGGKRAGGSHSSAHGKDHPEMFIEGALTGGHGPSHGLHKYAIDRPHQHILTAVPMDNVKLAFHEPTSILDTDWRGHYDDIGHSLKGAHTVNQEVEASGHLDRDIIPNH